MFMCIKMQLMRTTLTIDSNVEQFLKWDMWRTGRGIKAVVNDALCVGPGMRSKRQRASLFRVEPHAFDFKPGTDTDRLNQFVDEMEANEFARKLAR